MELQDKEADWDDFKMPPKLTTCLWVVKGLKEVEKIDHAWALEDEHVI